MIKRILEHIRTLPDFDFKGRRAFVRVDFNCPMDRREVADNTRIVSTIPTIRHILDHGGRVIIASHLGRPEGYEEEFSIKPVARELGQLLGEEVRVLPFDLDGEDPGSWKESENRVLMTENLRFYPGETRGDEDLASFLSETADIYINDAFGASHRKHLSVYALPGYFTEKGIGFLVEKELKAFCKVLKDPEKPYTVIMGGSKVSDKIKVLEHLLPVADQFLIGGAMAYTLLKAKGCDVGASRVEEERLDTARRILEEAERLKKDFILPVDHCLVKTVDRPGEKIYSRQIETGYMGVDIGPETVRLFSEFIRKAKTIVWNGPMGIFEIPDYAVGTNRVAEEVSRSGAYTVVGGGDSVRALRALGVGDEVGHMSTGGGASLKLLEGNGLPGINILLESP
ncbi:MAG TPA: phosphoglycerate kinase [Candidatus Mcinerneyibacteriales bacterium]|nr:phosphoglycerate kinase [Candidatus Mcinerneyibacteriales bacterium]HPJ69611.1 phosphoglycerate kinase [Candidatus Mcinerneyibacteriales bacterium]